MTRYWRVLLVALALMMIGAYQLYGIFSNEGYRPAQPINFSHVMHAGVLQMECVYCHYSAEKASHAAIPSTELCMGCHSIVLTQSPEIQKLAEYYDKGEPVPWKRIHRLPDHAYFNHRWHVEAGVSCQECHGPIQNMPVVGQWRKLEMADCMKCHRQDNFVDQINHPPSYHEYPGEPAAGGGEAGEAPYQARGGMPVAAAFESAKDYIEKYHGDRSLTEEEAEAWRASLAEYSRNYYEHGRLAQLRNMNASIECSTCHY